MSDTILVAMGVILFIALVGVLLIGGFAGGNHPVVNKPECNDGIDNDNDGKCDCGGCTPAMPLDPGCIDPKTKVCDPELNNEAADKQTTICKSDNDCTSNKDGKRCLTVYPGDFIPFCGCITSMDCTQGGNCDSYNKCS